MKCCPHGYSEEQIKDDLCSRCMRAEINKHKRAIERVKNLLDVVSMSATNREQVVGIGLVRGALDGTVNMPKMTSSV